MYVFLMTPPWYHISSLHWEMHLTYILLLILNHPYLELTLRHFHYIFIILLFDQWSSEDISFPPPNTFHSSTSLSLWRRYTLMFPFLNPSPLFPLVILSSTVSNSPQYPQLGFSLHLNGGDIGQMKAYISNSHVSCLSTCWDQRWSFESILPLQYQKLTFNCYKLNNSFLISLQ